MYNNSPGILKTRRHIFIQATKQLFNISAFPNKTRIMLYKPRYIDYHRRL